VLVAAHQASERGGGAGALPLRLFGRLRARVEERYDWDELTGQRLRIYRQLVPAPWPDDCGPVRPCRMPGMVAIGRQVA